MFGKRTVAVLIQINLATKNPATMGQSTQQKRESRSIMTTIPDAAGHAALAICESLLLALNDRNILPEREIVGILHDAAAAHELAPDSDGQIELHQAVADLINRIIAGGNSVRRR
jgi:hypothetical protein